MERAGVAPFHLAVVAGFLYSAPRESAAVVVAPEAAAALERRYAEAAARVEHALARADGTLATALEVYLAAYRVLTVEIGAADRGGAGGDRAVARAGCGARPSSFAAAVAAAARGAIDRDDVARARSATVAPAWDVASPTFGETPALLDEAVRARGGAAGGGGGAEPADVPPALTAAVALARARGDAAERDDVLFARAQAWCGARLLAVAARRWARCRRRRSGCRSRSCARRCGGDDAELAAAGGGAGECGRAAAARAAGWAMPVVIGDARRRAGSARRRGRRRGCGLGAWQGAGLGGGAPVGQLRGAWRRGAGAARRRRGRAAMTPAMALVVEGAAAMVCEHGSLLDHGAAMARELGIPCVVGCAGALSRLERRRVGLEVDGDARAASTIT